MKKFIKIMLIVIVVGFVGLVALGYFLGGSMESVMAEATLEAEEFAKTANKDQCIESYVHKLGECDDMSCGASVGAFGVLCLSKAKGDSKEFCSDKPTSQADFYKSKWKEEFCGPKDLDTSSCLNVYKIIEAHCEN